MFKRIILFLVVCSFLSVSLITAQPTNQKPEPLDKKEFEFPKYTSKNLKNGLKVFLLEDKEQPTLYARLLLEAGNIYEKKDNVADFVAELITKGAGKRSAAEIANALDGVGASVSASAGAETFSIYTSGLSKHQDIMLEIMRDVVTSPKFPKDELEKFVPKMVTSVKSQKSQPSALAGDMARMIIYGKDSKYAARATEENVKAVKIEDVKAFYSEFINPNNATLLLVGDFDSEKMFKKIESLFSTWKSGKKPLKPQIAVEPMPLGVYFVERPASVQSTTRFLTPTLAYGAEDYESIDIASRFFTSGFAGRLFRTIREQYSYTYSPTGAHTRNRYQNFFYCGADVRNDVTDSAIVVMLDQIQDLATQAPDLDEHTRIVNFNIGQYDLAMENSSFIGNLIQNADFNGKTVQYMQNYPKRVRAMTPETINKAANKYLNPANSYIVVVGSPDVKEKLASFGKMYSYNLDLEPVDFKNDVKISPKELLSKYTEAIGGKAKLETIRSISFEGIATINMQGQSITGSFKEERMAPNKLKQALTVMGQTQVKMTDGVKGMSIQGPMPQLLEGEELASLLDDAVIFAETKMLENAFEVKIKGSLGNQIVVDAKKNNSTSTYFFNKDSFLLEKIEKIEEMQGMQQLISQSFGNYTNVDGIKLPLSRSMSVGPVMIDFELKAVVNGEVDASIFNIE